MGNMLASHLWRFRACQKEDMKTWSRWSKEMEDAGIFRPLPTGLRGIPPHLWNLQVLAGTWSIVIAAATMWHHQYLF